MLKGVYKEIICVKIKDNRLYESAFFVLKGSEQDKKASKISSKELAFEANRILCEEGVKRVTKKGKRARKILFPLLFLILGAIIGFFFAILLLL